MSAADTSPSLERIVPDELSQADPFGQAVLALNLERYRFAARWAPGTRALDIACGVGYGTEILRAAGAREVVGVDRDRGALDDARARYGAPSVSFVEADAESFSDPRPFDLAVSLETVEHVERPDAFLERLARLRRPGGHLIASVPISPSTDINPFHLHDFAEVMFRSLISRLGLRVVDQLAQSQSVVLSTLLGRASRHRPVRGGLLSLYARSPSSLWRRARWTLRHGLSNRYLVLAAQR